MSNLDDFYRLLDSIGDNSDDSSLEDIRRRINSRGQQVNFAGNSIYSGNALVIRKPQLPVMVDNYDSRLQCFMRLLEAVNYGSTNSYDYVEGHRSALERYYTYATSNPQDLSVVEGSAKDEVLMYKGLVSMNAGQKGYYDGLNYVIAALQRSKELMMNKLAGLLRKELG